MHSIHVPTNDSFGQFDDQIVGLAKLVVDSLNEEQLGAETSGSEKGEKGIAKLERFQAEQQLDSSLGTVLRRVQGARTRSGAHRKGGDFDVAILLYGAADLPSLFNELLQNLIQEYSVLSGLV